MRKPRFCTLLLILFFFDPAARIFAQTDTAKVLTLDQLQVHSDALMQKALVSPTGESGEKLQDFGDHWLLLMARARTGESELHRLWADEIVVRSGDLTLIVGGTMTGTHPYLNLPGEFHGSGLDGGVTHILHAGEVAYIPANVPHWMKVEPGHHTVVLIFKEKESAP